MEGTNISVSKLYSTIISLYTELYKQATLKSSRHTYIPSIRNKVLICKFIGWLLKTYKPSLLGPQFLITYFEFQFNRYIGINTNYFGRNAVDINWLIGPKAIGVWESRNPAKKKFIKYRISRELHLHLSNIFAADKKVTVNNFYRGLVTSLIETEELEKQRHYNTKVGYLHCADMTTLYNPVSEFCNGCSFKGDCIKRLKANFSNIYKTRMEKPLKNYE